MDQSTEVFIGIKVAKARNAVALVDGERGGEVRYLGVLELEVAEAIGMLDDTSNAWPGHRHGDSGERSAASRLALSRAGRPGKISLVD